MIFDITKLRQQTALRKINLETERLAEEHSRLITLAIRESNKKLGLSIDRTIGSAPRQIKNRAVCQQTKVDRISLHEKAENNPALKFILKQQQIKRI
jgi:hypothetical protein